MDPDLDPDESLELRPPRGAFLLAFASVIVAGLLGAGIGAGLADTSCDTSCGGPVAVGALVGGLAAAAGVAVVAILVLRAMVEWNTQRARDQREPPEPRDLEPDDPRPPTC